MDLMEQIKKNQNNYEHIIMDQNNNKKKNNKNLKIFQLK